MDPVEREVFRRVDCGDAGILQCPGILGRDDVDDDGTSAALFSFSGFSPVTGLPRYVLSNDPTRPRRAIQRPDIHQGLGRRSEIGANYSGRDKD
jgi:hypothetical protein